MHTKLAISLTLLVFALAGCGSSDEGGDAGAQRNATLAQEAMQQVERRKAQRARAIRRARTQAKRRQARQRAARQRAARRRARAQAQVETVERREAEEAEASEAEEPASECDLNYSGACLDPYASDYDCEGGSGDGPAYTGEVAVVGEDTHGLDSDSDGVGCEPY